MKSLLPLAALLLAATAPARALKLQIGDDNVRKGDYTVEKGQTFEGDLAAKGSVTVKGVVTGDCAAFGGPLVVEGECRGEAASFGGPVRVAGKIGGDLASFGGPVDLSGVAGGEVALFGGDLTLRSSGTIEGGVSIFGGRLNQESGARIRGEVHNFNSRLIGAMAPGIALAAMRADRRAERDGRPRKVLISGFLAGLCLLPFLLTLFFPGQVEAVAAAASADFWRALGIGLLVEMAVVPATLALAVSVIGIPFIPVAYAALAASFVMGMGAFFLLMSRRVCLNLGKPAPSTIKAVGLAGAATAAVSIAGGLLPVIGGVLGLALFLTLCCGMTLGLGAVWLTRLGTRAL
ncbi:MAG: polymer-forming cytoskeletal protein [Elusimicrobia bacterium]|nr:polymer-forming cytoskeletal protein [Elusimicrobiota bacterium]